MLHSFQLSKVLSHLGIDFFVFPFGEVDRPGIIGNYYLQFTNEDIEVRWNRGEVTKIIKQVHGPGPHPQSRPWLRGSSISAPGLCSILHLLNSHFQELHKTTSFAWFPKLLIVPLFFIHLVDNKSIHLKTRRIQCSAVVCYTHVHFPYIFFEQNTVKSIVQLAGVISLW